MDISVRVATGILWRGCAVSRIEGEDCSRDVLQDSVSVLLFLRFSL
jgi:hypothetical protein